jgi:hypothetical protein
MPTPLSGPLLMLLLALVFGMCILRAITTFISLQMEKIKLQLLVTQYRSLGQEKLYKISKVSIDACPQVEKASKGGNEEEDSLETGS